MQRTYGGHPEAWLHMPHYLLQAYAEMRPRLEAEAFLDTAQAIMLGSGRMRKTDANRLLASVQRRAHGDSRQPGQYRPRTTTDWAAIPGVQVIREPA